MPVTNFTNTNERKCFIVYIYLSIYLKMHLFYFECGITERKERQTDGEISYHLVTLLCGQSVQGRARPQPGARGFT